jgi:hypothetical protein
MQQAEYKQFGEVMKATAEMYGKTLSPSSLALWWQAMRDLDLSAIQHALSQHINNPDNGQFMPKPADVRKHLSGTTSDAALFAWAKVLKACREIGAYTTVAFDDPVIMAVLSDMGGWVQLCHSTEDEQPFREKEFTAKYRAYKGRPADEISFPGKLLGIIDAENMPRGNGVQPVTLIGDPEVAQKVLEGAKNSGLQISVSGKEPERPMPRLAKTLPMPIRPMVYTPEQEAALKAAEAELATRKIIPRKDAA